MNSYDKELKDRAVDLYNQGDLTGAGQLLQQVLSRNPQNSELLVWMARLYCDMHRYQESLNYVHTALQLNPKDAEAWKLTELIAKQSVQTISASHNSKQLHVILIQPAEPFVPLAEIPHSIVGLASILQEGGVSVEILDARINQITVSQTMQMLSGKQFDVVGITGLQASYRYIKDFCFEFKRKYPHTPLMAGGVFILTQPEIILPRVPIDVACIGDAEEIILELVTRLVNKESLEGIPNIAYMCNGEVVKTEIRYIEDYDKFPFPAYDLLQMDLILKGVSVLQQIYNIQYYFPIVSGRGCVHHCYYCGRASRKGKKVGRISPERLMEYMDFVNSRYGVTAFLLSEDSAFYPREWILRVCDLLIEKGKYNVLMSGCPEQLDEEIFRRLLKAGCREFNIAVEHWNPEIQKGFFRKTQSKHIIRVWELFNKYNIQNRGFNILWGHPKDTAESFRESYLNSIEMVKEYDISTFWLAALCVYPNTVMLKDALKMGKIVDFEDHMYACGGYGPYVNLTSEDDDVFRGVIIEQVLMNEIEFYMEELNFCLFDKDAKLDISQWDAMVNRCQNLMGTLANLKKILTIPKPQREQYRQQLEQILGGQLYDPKRNYYHEIACFKEVLELEKGSRLTVYLTNSFGGNNTPPRLFNSIREAQLEMKGFAANVQQEGTFEGHRLVPLNHLNMLQADYFLIPDDGQHAEEVIKVVSQYYPGLKIIKLSQASLAPKPWTTRGLTSGYHNKKFWRVKPNGKGGFIREMRQTVMNNEEAEERLKSLLEKYEDKGDKLLPMAQI